MATKPKTKRAAAPTLKLHKENKNPAATQTLDALLRQIDASARIARAVLLTYAAGGLAVVSPAPGAMRGDIEIYDALRDDILPAEVEEALSLLARNRDLLQLLMLGQAIALMRPDPHVLLLPT